MPVLKPLSGNPEAPKQYNQPSRKGKKAWRKNVDVTEVEQGLDELNAQIIKGYGAPSVMLCITKDTNWLT